MKNTLQEIRKGSAWVTNSHAQNTQEDGLRLLVDWVTCSFHFASKVADLLTVLGLHNVKFEKLLFARYDGYSHTYRMDKMEILVSEDENKYMINFSGQACRLFEQSSHVEWTQLFGLLLENFQAKFTRLDIAIDDFSQIYKTGTIRQAVYKKLCVTRVKKWGTKEEGNIEDGNDYLTMDSFYIGGLKSRYFLNVYDKKVEREENGMEVTVSSWTRTELRLKNEYATRFAVIVANGRESLGYYTMSFINEKIQFLKPGVYTNKSRSAEDKTNISRWWLKFLGKVGKLNLSEKAPDKTIQTTVNWMKHQVAPSVAMIYEAEGADEFEKFMQRLRMDGEKRLTKKQTMMIDDYQQQRDLAKKVNKEKYHNLFVKSNKRLTLLKTGTKQQKEKAVELLTHKFLENNIGRDINPMNKKNAHPSSKEIDKE